MTLSLLLSLLLQLASLHAPHMISNTQPNFSDPDPCIQEIMNADQILGQKRNHGCEKISLEKTIQNYVQSLRQLDYSDCPEPFTQSFNLHIDAWENIIPAVQPFEALRGEMHDLFDQIGKSKGSESFKEHLDKIWATWDEVEKHL